VAGSRAAERRLARELHDGVLPLLGAARLTVERLAERARAGRAVDEGALEEVSARLAAAYTEIRAIAHGRASAPAGPGLEGALDALARDFARATGIEASFSARGAPAEPAPAAEPHLLRIAQEALANVARHAAARRVRIELARGRRGLSLTIEDDGRGIARGARAGFGLQSIGERARLLGGAARLAAARRGPGTRLVVEVPHPRPAPGD
jgi:two-component system NarL family sensor kinase